MKKYRLGTGGLCPPAYILAFIVLKNLSPQRHGGHGGNDFSVCRETTTNRKGFSPCGATHSVRGQGFVKGEGVL
jgi:hypothetical protein